MKQGIKTEKAPARECIEVARLPLDADVEISAICVKLKTKRQTRKVRQST